MNDIIREHFWACWWFALIFLFCLYDWIMRALWRWKSQPDANEWISVDDHLPDSGEQFLAVDSRGLYCVYEMNEDVREGNRWIGPPATHWMALPDPPTR